MHGLICDREGRNGVYGVHIDHGSHRVSSYVTRSNVESKMQENRCWFRQYSLAVKLLNSTAMPRM